MNLNVNNFSGSVHSNIIPANNEKKKHPFYSDTIREMCLKLVNQIPHEPYQQTDENSLSPKMLAELIIDRLEGVASLELMDILRVINACENISKEANQCTELIYDSKEEIISNFSLLQCAALKMIPQRIHSRDFITFNYPPNAHIPNMHLGYLKSIDQLKEFTEKSKIIEDTEKCRILEAFHTVSDVIEENLTKQWYYLDGHFHKNLFNINWTYQDFDEMSEHYMLSQQRPKTEEVISESIKWNLFPGKCLNSRAFPPDVWPSLPFTKALIKMISDSNTLWSISEFHQILKYTKSRFIFAEFKTTIERCGEIKINILNTVLNDLIDGRYFRLRNFKDIFVFFTNELDPRVTNKLMQDKIDQIIADALNILCTKIKDELKDGPVNHYIEDLGLPLVLLVLITRILELKDLKYIDESFMQKLDNRGAFTDLLLMLTSEKFFAKDLHTMMGRKGIVTLYTITEDIKGYYPKRDDIIKSCYGVQKRLWNGILHYQIFEHKNSLDEDNTPHPNSFCPNLRSRYYDSPPLFDRMANALCKREKLWSPKGVKLVEHFKHPETTAIIAEFRAHVDVMKRMDLNGKGTIKGKEFHYPIEFIPKYLIEELMKNENATSKGAKAIFYGLFCGFHKDSAILKHWKNDWEKIITSIHPQISKAPESFFFDHIGNDLDKVIQDYEARIQREFGDPDVFLKIEGKILPAHSEVLKSYGDLVGNNYFSALLSGPFNREANIIDLDYMGELPNAEYELELLQEIIVPITKLTYRGVALILQMIYRIKGTSAAMRRTFDEDWSQALNYLYPEINDLKYDLKTHNGIYFRKLYNLRLQHLIDTMIGNFGDRPNSTEIVEVLANFYNNNPLRMQEESFCQLEHMCHEAFEGFRKAQITFLDDAQNLIDLVQHKLFPKFSNVTGTQICMNYPRKDNELLIRYYGEHLEEVELDPEMFCDIYVNATVFTLGEKGRALFRNHVFNDIKKILSEEKQMEYTQFEKILSTLNEYLCWAQIEPGSLIPEEIAIIEKFVIAIHKRLPMPMLAGDENFKLKKSIIENWNQFNELLGTKIPFIIDFGE